MAHFSEQDLAEVVISWLAEQHWDVYQEVRVGWRGRIADIVAVRGPLVWVIECKRSLNMQVMSQAYSWQAVKRSIAVPYVRNRRDQGRDFAYVAAGRFGIGILEIGKNSKIVYERVIAPILRYNYAESKKIRASLNPGHKTHARAGSAGGGHWTPYKQTMNEVRSVIGSNPGCTLHMIMKKIRVKHHYGSDATARSCIGQALREWEPWCFVDDLQMPARYYMMCDCPPLVETPLLMRCDDVP